MSLRTAAQQALEALEERYVGALRDKAMDALRTALAEPERKPLTDEEIMEILDYGQYGSVPAYQRNFVRAIERAHGIGGEEA
jgi:propanediol dehydratase large subunit